MNKNDPLYIKSTKANLEKHGLPDQNFIPSRGGHSSSANVRLAAGKNRFDTDFHRPEDRIPTKHHDIVQLCQGIYRKNGFVRNVIDLMADFASEGLDLRHPVKSQERLYNEWAKRVNLQGRAHDFIKLMLRDANVIVRRKMATVSKPVVKDMSKAYYDFLAENVDENKNPEKPEKITKETTKIVKNEIPWGYTFISPVIVEKIGGSVGKFFGSSELGMRILPELEESIRNPKTDAEKKLISKLPKEVIDAVKSGSKIVALDPSRMYIDYYKKDDWEDWGTPFLYGIIEDILLKDKMKQADAAALDGVINTVRLWKLGNSDKQILPTPAAVNKLLGILQNNVGGGMFDIVWDDMIDMEVTYPPTDKILGSEKYKAVNSDITKGLGIPDSLVGGTDLGTRNAQTGFIQLKTLVERLEYVRAKCIKWLENELTMIAKALGFKKIPNITFENMSLRDETAEKQLMIQLLDRNLISVESVYKVFGNDFAIELENMRFEEGIRNKEAGILEKANPYYRPKSIMEFQKDSQLELEAAKQANTENMSGDLPRTEQNSPSGRPPGQRDTEVRDNRTPKTLSVLKANAEEIMDEIDAVIDPIFLSKNSAKNIRSLTKKQKDELQTIKHLILSNCKNGDVIDINFITSKINNPSFGMINKFNTILDSLINEYKLANNKDLSIGVYKSLACSAWAIKEI